MYLVCCKILGVNPGSDEETIRAAYRKSAKQLHPDVNDSERAHEYFVILQNSYQYLLKHTYTKEEAMLLQQAERIKKQVKENSRGVNYNLLKTLTVERYTLREVLHQSRTARILYIVFHILFLSIGILLLYRSIYDVMFFKLEREFNNFSAYFTIVFGFFFGLIITSIFLYTGITFIRNR